MRLSAIRDDNPVVFLEHKLLYGGKGTRKESASIDFGVEVPSESYEVPLGSASVVRAGSDLTILANMLMVHRALAAAQSLSAQGIEVELIDMRSLVPLDLTTIEDSVKKT